MRPNWFFAFPLDGSFIANLPPPPPDIRLFNPADVHITVAFLGGCGEEAARGALAALDAELATRPASVFRITLGEVVPLGPKPQYSALSALLRRGRAEAEACMARLGGVLGDAGFGGRAARAPLAHATLARPHRRATDASRRAGLDWAAALDVGGVSAQLDRIALYTWSEGDRREHGFRIVAERRLAP